MKEQRIDRLIVIDLDREKMIWRHLWAKLA